MRPNNTRSGGHAARLVYLLALTGILIYIFPELAEAQIGLNFAPPIPGSFEPEVNYSDRKPLPLAAFDSLAALPYENQMFKVETEFDSASGYYVSQRYLFNDEYGRPRVFTPEDYSEYRIKYRRKKQLRDHFFSEMTVGASEAGGGGIELQVPFRIRSRTFRRIFGGDRVGLRVTGNITVDGGLRREKSDQINTSQTDQANYNFKIDQQQQFHITGKVGDKVSVEIDQNSERAFDFENNVKLTYEGTEDEIIQSLEAGNISMSLPGTQLATLSGANKGLFGFKTVAKVGPLSITALASLQQGENNKLSVKGGATKEPSRGYETEFLRERYFFLHQNFRNVYSRFNSSYLRIIPSIADANLGAVKRIRVFKSGGVIAGDNSSTYEGWALTAEILEKIYQERGDLPTDAAGLQALVEELDSVDSLDTSRRAESGIFKELDPETDYTYNEYFGTLRLNSSAGNEILAVSYELNQAWDPALPKKYGVVEPNGQYIVLQMIKPKIQTEEDVTTFPLEMKNIYWVGTTGLDPEDFEFKLIGNTTERKETNANGKEWLQVFGLDNVSEDGTLNPDNKIDGIFLDIGTGEIEFPDLQPFDPIGYTVNNQTVLPDTNDFPTAFRSEGMYQQASNSQQVLTKSFILESSYSNVKSTYDLKINVLEGSEEVYLNGRKLQKDKDYVIDYLSGQLKIINQEALSPGANLDITYESGEIFQLDRRTMVGVRVEYALWEDSFIGATLLYFNEKPIERRVKLGNEPLRNTIWDLNARLRFQPYFMTQMVDWLPLIETDEPSRLSFEGEIARVFPDPNSMKNEATGDDNGVAYIDDFEAAKRGTPLGISKRGWYPASHPKKIPNGVTPHEYFTSDIRGRMYWYTPNTSTPIKDIWPERETNGNVADEVQIMTIEFEPRQNNYRQEHAADSTWNGIMRWMTPGFYYQVDTKFIEIWTKVSGGGQNATMFIDMGEISEDVIPNRKLDTEDENIEGRSYGNGILDEGEDTGIDGMMLDDPPWKDGTSPWIASPIDYTSGAYDFWDLNGDGIQNHSDPDTSIADEPFSSDDWSYSSSSYEDANGTQGNNQEQGYTVPDTEDLDRDNSLNTSDHFYRYRFRFGNEEDSLKYIVGGNTREASDDKGWRLIRIPLEDYFDVIGEPDFSQIKYLRMFYANCTRKFTMKIAQFELVANEWKEGMVYDPVRQDSIAYVTSSTVNTFDNDDYEPPPGVSGEIDAVTNVRAKEQALVISVNELPFGAEGQLIKTLHRAQDLREYKKLKMFVHGGGRHPESLANKKLEMYLRFGSGFRVGNTAYYEYSQKLKPGWDDNEIIIDLDQLTLLKRRMDEEGGESAYEVLPNGDILKVVGNASIGNVNAWAIGLRNLGAPIYEEDNVEIWVNELRASHVRREPGTALRSNVTAEFADFLKLNASLSQRDADFHQVDARVGSNNSDINVKFDGSVQLDKFIDPTLGISVPLSGSISQKLVIPKYTTANGDIRLETVAEGENLNIWHQFSKFAFNQKMFESRYLTDPETGEILTDSTGKRLQDPVAWGIDSLLTTDQQYAWNTSFAKNKESANIFLKYSIDKVNLRFSNSQTINSNQNYQYRRAKTNQGSASYSLSVPAADWRIFKWTENTPVIKGLADSKFSPWPSRLSASVDGSEKTSNDRLRNGSDRPTYNVNTSRSYGIGFRPFQSMNFDYNYSVSSIYAAEDSVRQTILYSDQPDSIKNLTFEPTEAPFIIIEETLDDIDEYLQAVTNEQLDSLYTEVSRRYLEGEGTHQEIIDYLFEQLDSILPGHEFKRPWEKIKRDDQRYKDIFWTVWNLPFVDKQKTERVSTSYNPELFRWLGTDFNYSNTYSWSWSNWSHQSRQVQSNNTYGATATLKLRQLLPRQSTNSRGGRNSRNTRRDNMRRNDGNDPLSRGEDPGSFAEGQEGEAQGEEEEKRPPIPKIDFQDILKGALAVGNSIHDIRFNYNHSRSLTNPSVADGDASLGYRFGFDEDPGLQRVANAAQNNSKNLSDDYQLSSGFDVTSRVTVKLDYRQSNQKTISSQRSGSDTHSGFLQVDGTAPDMVEVPDWSIRWSGIEQFGPLSNFATSISFDHARNGSFTEKWNENLEEIITEEDTTEAYVKSINSRDFSNQYSPLIGVNVTWKYGISTSARINKSTRMGENPNNNSVSRDTNDGWSVNASYSLSKGFRIPIPVWPFKNKTFNNQMTVNLQYERSTTGRETSIDGNDFEETQKTKNWSLQPSLTYSFSRSVTGSFRLKWGGTENAMGSTKFFEIGMNVSLSFRG